ncbi:MAG: site-specific integrase [Candidatus Kapabacteria bacterium]|nr:site-specific integrase [Candidatus Kapabacteria bacterium]
MKKKIAGSIFVDRRSNKIIIHFNKKRTHTGLSNTPQNLKIAERILLKQYLEFHGIAEKMSRQTISDAYHEFLEIHCKHLSPKTIIGYKLAINTIAQNKKLPLTTDNLKEQVHNFIRRFDGTDATFNIYLRAFQVFINYCVKNEYISPLQAFKNHKRANSEKEIKVFTEEEISRIIDYFDVTDKEFSILIKLLVETGMRISEALNLEISHIRNDRIMIPNKINKNKPEMVYISENLKEQLQSLNTPKIFRWKLSSYSRINRTFRKTLKKLDIQDDRSFHELRKTYLKRLIDAGTPLEIAQKLMRHKDINVTIKFYAYIQDADLKQYQAKVQK